MPIKPETILPLVPEKPGVYQFMDSSGNLLYVGKAKNLKKRLASYFTRNQSGKTTVMLNKASLVRHIVVETESDALLLENNLIKKHQPRYNILLKDDKTYPWICIKKENFPRVFSTRNTIKDGSVYYGPYTSGLMVKTLIDLVRQLYKPRTCALNLSQDAIKSGKFRVCLEYHIGNCKAPCVGLQSEEEYNSNIQQIRDILKGNISNVIEHLKDQMGVFSAKLRFEEAQVIKDKINLLAKFRSRSAIVSNSITNTDVFAFTQDNDKTYVNYMKVVNGAVVQVFTLDMKSRMDEEKESLLGFAVTEIRQRLSSDSPEIIIPFKPDILLDKIRYTIPARGDKQKLLELAERNAVYYKLEQRKKLEATSRKDRSARNLEKLKSDLHMGDLPVHIECFDNSNISGKNPVAACIVFRNAKPSKKEYRHFNIRTISGPDDFSSMEEIVFRRYKRMIEEKQNLPQLIVVDGGKGQLSAAVRSLDKLKIKDNVTTIGIAKKLEEIFFPGDSVPLYLDKNSVSLKIIQQLRNEAHRFGINFHRDKRSSAMIKNEIDDIKGIGTKTKDLLLKKIGSLEKIRKTPLDELKKIIGTHKASILHKKLTD
jgi:excinuclease ABC subunit C